MMRRFSRFAIIAGLAVLAGCPDDPYKADTWTKKLKDQREAERAVTELEQLGNPSAIEPLGNAWIDQGKPGRLLQVIISLARPLTPHEAKANYYTDYEAAGRPASWDRALPYLKRALSEVDEANPRSVDSATKAAEALGEAQLPDGLDAAAKKIREDVAYGRQAKDLLKSCEDAKQNIRPAPGRICPDGLAILQADESTDGQLINKIVNTAKAAGFDNLLFAVKNK